MPKFAILLVTLIAASAATQEAEVPDTAGGWIGSAQTHYYDFAYGDAQAALDEALLLDPRNITALRLRACYAAAQGQWDSAVQTMERAESLEAILPERYDGTPLDTACANEKALQHLKLGLYFEQSALYVEAIEQYTFALALCPESPWARALRALAYAENADTDAASREFDRLITNKPDFLWPYLARAFYVHQDYGDYEAAIADIDTLLAHAPEDVEAWILRGDIHADDEDYTTAMEDYSRAIELDADNAAAFAARGNRVKYIGLSDAQSALPDLDRAIELDPENVDYYDYRADVHQYLGRFAEAMDDLSRSISLDGENAWPYVLRGYIRSERGDKSGALEDFNKALEIQPWFGWAYAERGTLYLNQGRILEAIADLRIAHQYDDFRISDPRPTLIFAAICVAALLTIGAIGIFLGVIALYIRSAKKKRATLAPPPHRFAAG